MVLNSQDIENIALLLPITSEARTIAYNFAAKQVSSQKAEQVLYNTLAVLTVKNYLEMLGIATDLFNSDSWNPIMRICDNVADLNILDLGKLECRPLKNSDSSCYIPMEVWDLRIGYVVVKINESLKQATILGFAPQVATEKLAITNLKPVEALIERLHDLRIDTKDTSLINLEEWFNNIFTTGWETIESLLNPEQLIPTWGFRNMKFSGENFSQLNQTNSNSVQRAKLIDLGIQLRNYQVVLLVEITPEANGSVAVALQVHPSPNHAYLPQGIILKVIELSGEVFMQAQSRSQDNFIQLQFSGQTGEHFAVQIVLDDAELTEQFQL
jgi:hypothetical protein